MGKPAIILSKDDFQNLLAKLKSLDDKLEELNPTIASEEKLVTNDQLSELMQVSKRTLQNWRDEGLITYTQIGKKILYRMSDVQECIEKHQKHAFAPPKDY